MGRKARGTGKDFNAPRKASFVIDRGWEVSGDFYDRPEVLGPLELASFEPGTGAHEDRHRLYVLFHNLLRQSPVRPAHDVTNFIESLVVRRSEQLLKCL